MAQKDGHNGEFRAEVERVLRDIGSQPKNADLVRLIVAVQHDAEARDRCIRERLDALYDEVRAVDARMDEHMTTCHGQGLRPEVYEHAMLAMVRRTLTAALLAAVTAVVALVVELALR